jgi:hypothetical protein
METAMKGVAAFIKEEEDGSIRLLFNDVAALSAIDTPDWKHIVLFTSTSYDAKAFKELSLSKAQFAQIGENLVLRLVALGSVFKSKP